MKHKIIFAACITVIVFVLFFGIGITTALNDEPTSETICDLKIHNKNVKITVVTPQLMMNDVVTKVEINQEQSYTFIGYDSIESIDVNADSLHLVFAILVSAKIVVEKRACPGCRRAQQGCRGFAGHHCSKDNLTVRTYHIH